MLTSALARLTILNDDQRLTVQFTVIDADPGQISHQPRIPVILKVYPEMITTPRGDVLRVANIIILRSGEIK